MRLKSSRKLTSVEEKLKGQDFFARIGQHGLVHATIEAFTNRQKDGLDFAARASQSAQRRNAIF
jgi:hypothetical protein